MRLLVTVVSFLLLGACQKASDPGPPGDPPATTVVASTTAAETPAEPHECGPGGCGGACGGGGGSCCGGAMAQAAPAPAKTVPADTTWAEMKVTGMHCGGCARRIKNALAQVDGVYDVEVDVASATVKVAVGKGQDGRALAAPKIDALGYHVVN